jgi:hypothetical protein
MGRSEQIRFHRVQVIIHGRDDAGFLYDLAVVVIHGVEMLGPIHDRRQGVKTALVFLLDGDMSRMVKIFGLAFP